LTVSDTLQYSKWSQSPNKPLKKAALLLQGRRRRTT